MDVSGEVADLMVKEGIQITEATVKMLAAGSKNLAAFLWALAKDNKRLVGKTNMGRLLKEGKELKVFRIKESDLAEFQAFAKKNVLFAAVKDNRSDSGMVDLITNVDFVSQVNLFMERRGYPAPTNGQQEAPKKAGPRVPQENSSQERGNGSTPSRPRPTRTTRTTDEAPGKPGTDERGEKPSVKGKLDGYRAEAEKKAAARKPQQRSRPKPKTR